ncbi:hypothetical protein CO051_05230 [Candidatus Roizmanbacteria bacterium CG_4_9_14_0_2_um_filter_39_13]|uniref:Uncharacterized protein n=1 Tax=Candidatus Roizmanbacteria bacterium CG_4_9_14_0_2_um_filter_39_13 TaxID=1974839 RepID=A0A2M8EXB5_9BACT|nr:MAG: hypothetical protein CO051_05230 [Candidatus Roizmanbacteria bacterium CG_4_9_14_0_2_um_filter_39_13]
MINWQQFGLRSNPYDTLPLIEGGELPIDKAFVGRSAELQILKDIFLSDTRACLTILGNVGVGKTSLINFHKFLCKYEEKVKPVFSFRREIEASTHILNKYSFLIEIIGSVLREIRLLDPELISSQNLLAKLERLVDITQTIGISGGVHFGIGNIDVAESSMNLPPSIPVTVLEGYFADLVKFIINTKIASRQFRGLIIHVNNFDILLSDAKMRKEVVCFFQEIRDLLQIPNVYYFFLGPIPLFRDIISSEKRIKSMFHLTPLVVNPLSKLEVVKALEERMGLLKSRDVAKFISPFSSEVIYKLYDLYQGDVRSIMNGLKAILSQVSEIVLEPLGPNEALLLLGKERWHSLEALSLTDEQIEVLKILATSQEMITQKDLAKLTNKAPSNISGYYLNPLKDAGIIELKKKKGNLKYWGLTQDYIPIKFILEAKKIIQQKTEENMQQLALFT